MNCSLGAYLRLEKLKKVQDELVALRDKLAASKKAMAQKEEMKNRMELKVIIR
jgi:hypothetical protein